MTKPIHLNHAEAMAALDEMRGLVAAMTENTDRLIKIKDDLTNSSQGAMNEAYSDRVGSYNRHLTDYDAQVKGLNNAVADAAQELARVDKESGNKFL